MHRCLYCISASLFSCRTVYTHYKTLLLDNHLICVLSTSSVGEASILEESLLKFLEFKTLYFENIILK